MAVKSKQWLKLLLVISLLLVLALSTFFSLMFNMSFFFVLLNMVITIFGIELLSLLILFIVQRRLFGFLKMIKPDKDETVEKVILKVFAVFLLNWVIFFIFGYKELDNFLIGLAGFIVIWGILQIKKHMEKNKRRITIYLAAFGSLIILFGLAMIITSLMSMAIEDIKVLFEVLKLIF